MGHDGRDALYEAARGARARARALVAETLVLRARFESLRLSAGRSLADADVLLGRLQGSVSDYVTAMRTVGEAPERVVTLVKELADEATLDAVAVRSNIDLTEARRLRETVVRWAIDSYYEPPPLPPPPLPPPA